MPAQPNQIWWSPDEIAAAGLPDLPTTKRRVNDLALREGWRDNPDHARRRQGKGGGWEYHWALFPARARKQMLRDAGTEVRAERPDRGVAWARYDALPEAAKAKAADRLRVVTQVDALHQSGLTKQQAVADAARGAGVSSRSVWGWIALIDGVACEDWLAYLVPRHGRGKKGTKTPHSEAFIAFLKADFLRLEQPSFASCYRRAVRQAEREGWEVMTQKTALRHIQATVPRVTQVFMREGEAGLERCFPAQIRDRSGMVAMEGANADCHKIDVFVEWPDGIIDRPQIVAFQDLYSGKLLSWRIDHAPNKVAVMGAFGDMIDRYGIPRHMLFDNGREFANKWLTGGIPNRFRFKVRADEPLGVLPMLGIEVHWARPGRGQSKPIERAFRDLANDVARHPAFAGAYVGNRPDAKPENYGSRAVPLDQFVAVLDEGIREHNARTGRAGQTAGGRSFDQVFDESYAVAPIRKATDEQKRLWLMGQEVRRLAAGDGALTLHKNKYWAPWMNERAGEEIVARFDPEDLHAGAYLYAKDGAYLGFTECQQAIGFFDMAGAQEQARRDQQIKRQEKKLADLHRVHSAAELAAMMAAVPAPEAPRPEAKVVRPAFARPKPGPTRKAPPVDPEIAARREQTLIDMQARRQAVARAAVTPVETADGRYARALDILARSDRGEDIGDAEMRWVRSYTNDPEFKARKRMDEARERANESSQSRREI